MFYYRSESTGENSCVGEEFNNYVNCNLFNRSQKNGRQKNIDWHTTSSKNKLLLCITW